MIGGSDGMSNSQRSQYVIAAKNTHWNGLNYSAGELWREALGSSGALCVCVRVLSLAPITIKYYQDISEGPHSKIHREEIHKPFSLSFSLAPLAVYRFKKA